jgi:metallo-beta-lactamase family protein
MPAPSLTFHGGAGTVTGSKYLVEAANARVLIDCGLFQGPASLRRRNWEPPGFTVDSLHAVVLSHAHLDHSGYLPALVSAGFRGPIYCTQATALLADIVLTDSAHLMAEEARQANEMGWSKHHPALPLYDEEDVERVRKLLTPVPFLCEVEVADGITATLGRAGHILGSAWVQLAIADGTAGRSVASSGDLGRPSHPLLVAPDPRPDVDTLLLESTYGARQHGSDDPMTTLVGLINRTTKRGSVLIPAFAVDRTEILLNALARARRGNLIPELPIVVDSPMALECLSIYRRAISERWADIRPGASIADVLNPGHVLEAHSAEESARWNDPPMPSILISASGMASGGRVLHHLRHLLPERRNSVVIVGYAAAGTRARELEDGARQLKIHGRYVPVRAEVAVIDAFSAHADSEELLKWATAGPAPDVCFTVHGEPEGSSTLARQLRSEAGWTAVVPRQGERVLL